jgi:peptidoglycan/LPS O-acetylase OafA/YrhL
MTNGALTRGERLDHIDCLRAVAALAVALHHFVDESLRLTGSQGWLVDTIFAIYGLADPGRFGVLLFFIISGYCIAHSILRPHPFPVAAFVVNRIARIYPAYWASIIAAIAIYGAVDGKVLLANVTLLQKFVGQPDMIGVYWTLAVELSFYGLCVLMFLFGLMGSFSRLVAVWGVLLGYSCIAAGFRGLFDVSLLYAWTWFLALMVGGAIIRRVDEDRPQDHMLIVRGAAIMIAAALLIAVCVYHDPVRYQKSWEKDFTANALAIGLFVVFHYGYRIRSVPLAYLGRISYSIYLFHILVWELTFRSLSGTFVGAGLTGAAVLTLLLVLLTIAASAAIYAVLEKPGIGLGRRLSSAIPAVRLERF